MGNFNRDRRSGGFGGRSRGGFGGRSFRDDDRGRGGFGRDRGERRPLEMHDVVCDKCGKNCQVPFKPTAGKPVYCSDCFEKPARNGGSSSGISSEQFSQLNTKLDKILKILESLEVVEEDEEESEEAEEEAE